MTNEFDEIVRLIEQEDVITIFRHEHPDCDALGSQFGLLSWITENFPEKKVYACGLQECTQGDFPAFSSVDDQIIEKSLAIVLDTANEARIDDSRSNLAKVRIKIDHHPNFEPYGTYNLVKPDNAATCEILTSMFVSLQPKYQLSQQTAYYLYQGILTDTLCFRTTNTTWHTLAMAAELAKLELDLAEINRRLFDLSLDEFQFSNYLRSQVQVIDDQIGYIVLKQEDLDAWHVTGSEARNHIDEIGHVKEFQAWSIFTQSETDASLYDASLRSKQIAVNAIAQKYNGGGHKNAAGVKKLSEQDIQDILKEMKQKIEEA